MKYEPEIMKLLEDSFRDEWMNDEDWAEFLRIFLAKMSLQELEETIEIGVRNGYSLEFQLRLIHDLIKSDAFS